MEGLALMAATGDDDRASAGGRDVVYGLPGALGWGSGRLVRADLVPGR